MAHSVGGADYGSVRAATFMARTVLRQILSERSAHATDSFKPSGGAKPSGGSHPPAQPSEVLALPPALPSEVLALEYLVHLSPSLLAELSPRLPTAMKGADSLSLAPCGSSLTPHLPHMAGADFLSQYGGHGDAATVVQPDVTYDLRACAAHPVGEHHRIQTFEALLAATPSPTQLALLGELMYQSHASYSAVGLGSPPTDLIVQLVREAGPGSGLHGAKITGGGSGGTVCVLGESTDEAEASFRRVVATYAERSGHAPYVVAGSSMGAVDFGALSK